MTIFADGFSFQLGSSKYSLRLSNIPKNLLWTVGALMGVAGARAEKSGESVVQVTSGGEGFDTTGPAILTTGGGTTGDDSSLKSDGGVAVLSIVGGVGLCACLLAYTFLVRKRCYESVTTKRMTPADYVKLATSHDDSEATVSSRATQP